MKNSKQNVRPLKLSSVSTILFLFFFPFNSICQSVSTISEIYNYEINDIFHTSESGYNALYGGFQQYSNIQVINKFYSPGNDTLNYICDVKTVYSGTNQPQPLYNNFLDTLSYTNLDSLINHGIVDTVYYSGIYNGRKVNYFVNEIQFSTHDNFCMDGCGGPYYHSYFTGYGYPISHELKLTYYKKGLEEWGAPYYVSINEIQNCSNVINIYPNPASDKIVFDIKDNALITCSGMIYSIFGS
jgi:hypothetical protein